MFLYPLLLNSALVGVSYQDEIKPTAKIMHGDKGDFVTLSCNYSGSPFNLQWYRQYPRSALKFLLLTTVSSNPSIVNATPPYPHLSIKLNKERTRVDLEISSADVPDSALYYCALQPTRGGATKSMSALTLQYVVYNMFEERIAIHSYLTAHEASHSDPMKMFYTILLFSMFIGSSNEEEIISATTEECVFEGEGVTLSCNYTGSYTTDTLLWYQQYPRSKPEFLLLLTEGGLKTHNESTHPRLSVKLNEDKTHVDLEISSTEVTDSALYYCALRPTVTGNQKTLYKNLTTHNIL
ncbi:uncharacterized protein [Salmo salar]|uniref:Ig-like domain-containing protein n=1 Tax=Salmo salar TaxID=8030 RepID=A0ABM3CSU3_SALSA|nr:uncharacterized protein LOC106569104 [Salmo salar]